MSGTPSSTKTLIRIPSDAPANEFNAPEGGIYTDTETQPGSSNGRYTRVPRSPFGRDNRNVQVQTKVFRTDQDNGAVNFQACYTTVNKSAL